MDTPISPIPASLDAQRLKDRATTHDRTKVNQDQFLELMLAQLKNQDPSKPIDNNQFVTQMAQISSASSMNDLQKSFSTLAAALQSTQALQVSTMVGRKVLVANDQFVTALGEQPKLGLDLASAASQVRVTISDAAGQTVRRLDLNARPAGISEFEWDGLDATGAPAPAGNYNVKAEALVDGKAQAATTLVRAAVESVTLPRTGDAPLLNLANIGTIKLDAIKRVL